MIKYPPPLTLRVSSFLKYSLLAQVFLNHLIKKNWHMPVSRMQKTLWKSGTPHLKSTRRAETRSRLRKGWLCFQFE